MRSINRKTAPKSIYGRVQKKNNWVLSPDYYYKTKPHLFIDRKRPGEGYRHILKQKDILEFIAIMPNWKDLTEGLEAIVLSPGDLWTFGYHCSGVVHVCAWPRDLWLTLGKEGYEQEKNY